LAAVAVLLVVRAALVVGAATLVQRGKVMRVVQQQVVDMVEVEVVVLEV
jgi:hypothetical protein